MKALGVLNLGAVVHQFGDYLHTRLQLGGS